MSEQFISGMFHKLFIDGPELVKFIYNHKSSHNKAIKQQFIIKNKIPFQNGPIYPDRIQQRQHKHSL